MLQMQIMMNRPTSLISLQEVARGSGLTLATLNYYVNLSLLPVAERVGNKRLFDRGAVTRRLDEIHRLRQQGYPLRLIRKQLKEAGAP